MSMFARVFYSLVLISLVVIFRQEFALNILHGWAYFTKDPGVELKLADFYNGNSRDQGQLADGFYRNVMEHFRAELKTESLSKRAMTQFSIGELYACGKGVPQDLNEAKLWYQQALGSATKAEENKEAIDKNFIDNTNQKIEALDVIIKAGSHFSCTYNTDLFSMK